MKKLAIIFAFIIFGATTSFAQFNFTRFADKEVSNSNKPDAEVYKIVDGSKTLDDAYYLTWEENYLKIQQVVYANTPPSVIETYLHYEDVVDDKISSEPETEEELKSVNKTIYRITPKTKMPQIWYSSVFYSKEFAASVSLPFANDKAYKDFIAKIKDKAFDLALKLDDAPERFSITEEHIKEDVPDANSTASTESDGEEETSPDSGSSESNSSSNSSSNSTSTPQAKTEVTVELRNRSGGEIDIIYKDNPKNSSKTETSISSRSSKRISIKVGGVVYDATGKNVLLTITAEMDGTSQIIAQ
jgi:hypothetical protein